LAETDGSLASMTAVLTAPCFLSVPPPASQDLQGNPDTVPAPAGTVALAASNLADRRSIAAALTAEAGEPQNTLTAARPAQRQREQDMLCQAVPGLREAYDGT